MKRFWQIVGVLVAVDQLSKWWLLYQVGMMVRDPIEVTPFFKLVMVWNQGVSFGMFHASSLAYMPWILIALALGISGVLIKLARDSVQPAERAAYALVVGGALGNVIDRLNYGAVADFFYFHWGTLGWPAFNVADASICIGVAWLLLGMLKTPAKS